VKLLLDECLPVDFRHSFPTHDCHTVQSAGFKGKKNGALLRAAEAAGYEVLLTVDGGIHHERPGRETPVHCCHSIPNQSDRRSTALSEFYSTVFST